MKIKNILFTGIIVIAITLFSGCFQESNKNQKEPETVALKDLCISVENLPEDYIQYYSGYLYLSEFSNQSNDAIVKWFTRGTFTNLKDSDLITCEINSFNTTDDAIQIYTKTIDYFITERNFTIINGSVNRIGDESKDLQKEGFTDLLTFRLSNYIIVMSSEDYSYTYELAKIVEQKIKDIS
jgi:hypothetical protein